MFTTQGGNEEQDDVNSKQKLECLATFSLFGNVMSMKAVRLPGALKEGTLYENKCDNSYSLYQ